MTPARSRRLRAGLAAFALLGPAGLLAGCADPGNPFVAVSLGPDGVPVVQLRLCKDNRVDFVVLHREGQQAGASTTFTDVWWVVNDSDTRRSSSLPVGATPDGWTARVPGPVTLPPGASFFLNVEAGPKPTAGLSFTTEQVTALHPDEVRTVEDDGLTGVTQPLKTWERRARDAC